jgi:hypothetical protein
MEHRRHQGAFLLRQALCRVEKKIAAYGRQTPSAGGARRRIPVRYRSSNRPFFRHHPAGLSDFG